MQALILSGGQGTRLRPLTLTVPKPVVPILDRPHVVHMVDWLRRFGVDDVVLACGHMAKEIKETLGDGTSMGVRVRYVEEPEPRGTAGAIKEAEPLLDERFLVLNGDILADLDLAPQLELHESTGALATIGLIPVDDPSAYGVVVTDPAGAVQAFVEKPAPGEAPTNLINAGVYVLERSILEGVAAGADVSIERDVFPTLAGKGLHALELSGYWLDIGTPERYLEAHWALLDGDLGGGSGLDGGPGGVTMGFDCEVNGEVTGSAWLDDESTVADGASIGPRVVLGAGTTVGAGATIRDSVLLAGVTVGEGCEIEGAVIAPGATIGEGSRIGPDVVIGERATVPAESVLGEGSRVDPDVGDE
jgi:mannose-1-phosphate guanylyltransferase